MALSIEIFQSALRSEVLGRSARFTESTASTNDDVRMDALGGAPHGHLVAAEIQTRGRGRLGRQWEAPAGVNLTFSLLLRPQLPVARIPSLTLCAAVGCREAIREVTGAETEIKWPNDLMSGGRKLCGILSEMSLKSGTSQPEADFAIIGIGLNVNADTDAFPPPLNTTASSLKKICGREICREILLASLMLHLEQAFSVGLAGLIDKYRQYSATIGTRVRAELGTGLLEGRAEDITPEGSLLIRTDDGSLAEILSGDVFHLRPAAADGT